MKLQTLQCTFYDVYLCSQQKLGLEDQLAEKDLQFTQQHKETQRLAEMLRQNNEAWVEEKEALNQVRTVNVIEAGDN